MPPLINDIKHPQLAADFSPADTVPQPTSSLAAMDGAAGENSSPSPTEPRLPRRSRISRRRLVGFALVAIALMGGAVATWASQAATKNTPQAALGQGLIVKPQTIALSALGQQLAAGQLNTGRTLTVNGQLNVTDSLVLVPSSQPTNAVAGQLYYDQTSNQMRYFNGSQFVVLQGGGNTTNTTSVTNVTSSTGSTISGTSGALALFGPSGTTLGDSRIAQTGTTLDIATTGNGPVNIGSQNSGSVTIAGGASSSFTSAGSLTLGAGSGVIVKPQTDSTTAFAVKNAAGTVPLLNVDTLGSAVSLGLGSAASFGNTRIGNVNGCCNVGKLEASKFNTIGGGTITSISAFIGWGGTLPAPHNQFQLAIYADNGSGTAPGAYIASTAASTLIPTTVLTGGSWNTLPINATLSAGTTYWLAYWNNTNLNDSNNALSFSSPANGALYQANTAWASGPSNGMPTTFPAGGLTPNFSASLYASFAVAGPALTLGAGGLVTAAGPVLFQDPTDSATAFQVQDSLGSNLLTADTANMIVTVAALAVTTDITVNGHIIGGGGTPGIVAGAAACTTPSVAIAGTDTAGTITVTTGSGCAAGGTLATTTFASAFAAAPHVVLAPGSAGSAALNAYIDDSNISATAFDLDTSAVPTNATTYKWNYVVVQ